MRIADWPDGSVRVWDEEDEKWRPPTPREKMDISFDPARREAVTPSMSRLAGASQGLTLSGVDEALPFFTQLIGQGPDFMSMGVPEQFAKGPPLAEPISSYTVQSNYRAAREAHPLDYLTGQLLGGLALGMASGPAILGNAPSLLRAVVGGGTEGLIEGALSGETPEERMKNAAWGAGISGGVPLAFGVGGRMLNRASDIEQVNPVMQRVGDSIQLEGDSIDDLARSARVMGDDAVLADVLGPATFDDIARVSGTTTASGKKWVQKLISNRRTRRIGRMLQAFRRNTDVPEEYFDDLARITAQTQKEAAPYYERAFRQSIKVDDELADMFKSKMVRDEWRAARNAFSNAQVAGDYPKNIVFPAEVPQAGDNVPLAAVDYLKRRLQGIGYNTGKNPQDINAARKISHNIMARFDDNRHPYYVDIPDYREARRLAGEYLGMEEAYKIGYDAIRGQARRLDPSEVASMPLAERHALVAGVYSGVKEKMDDVTRLIGTPELQRLTRTGGSANMTQLASQSAKDKLRAVLPEGQADEFIASLESEFVKNANENLLNTFAGSRTEPLRRSVFSATEIMNGVSANNPAGMAGWAVDAYRRAMKRVAGGIPEKYQEPLARMLFDPQMRDEALRQLRVYGVSKRKREALAFLADLAGTATAVPAATGYREQQP